MWRRHPATVTRASARLQAQGNEWPVCVVIVHGSHSVMLNRGLLYTAMSRAQQLVYVVGTKKVVRRARGCGGRRRCARV